MDFKTLLLIFCCSISFGQQKDTIYGKVKSIREELIFLDANRQNYKIFAEDSDYCHGGFVSPQHNQKWFYDSWYNSPFIRYSNYYKKLNEKGKPTYEIWFDKKGDTVDEFFYKYDKNDNLIQIKRGEGRNDDDYTIRNYHYNSKNIAQSTVYYRLDDPSYYSYSQYVRDNNGNIVQSKSFDQDGETYGFKYTFYPNNKIKALYHYSPYRCVENNCEENGKGVSKLERTYNYNDNGNEKEIIYYKSEFSDDSNKIISRTFKEYENGSLVKETFLNRMDKITKYILYTYNQQKQVIKKAIIYTDNDIANTTYQYFYNANGNQTKLIYIKSNKSNIAKFDYKFDKQNNWIEQTKYVDGKKLYVWKRKIKYFR